jgi:phage-related protein
LVASSFSDADKSFISLIEPLNHFLTRYERVWMLIDKVVDYVMAILTKHYEVFG